MFYSKRKGSSRTKLFLTLSSLAGLVVTLTVFAYFRLGFLNASGPLKTFLPTEIAFSGDEIVNPFRGLYEWRNQEIAPLPEPSLDSYDRYEWRDLEPSVGTYDFSDIETDIARVASEGRKFGLRVRAMRGYGNGVTYVPNYLSSYGWTADTDGNGSGDTFIPDWNNPYYLERAEKLVQAIAAEYDNDPRVAWIEIGLYGQYGEWSISSSVDYSKAPSGITAATQDTKNKIIDFYVDSFRNLQLSTSFFTAGNEYNSLLYAFNHPRAAKPIGWRTDCLGRGDYFDRWINNPSLFDAVKDRWKVAPVIAEFCKIYPNNSRDNFTNALQQIETYHVSMVGNGNTDPYANFSAAEKQQFVDVGKKAGYRMVLERLTTPETLQPGTTAVFQSSWKNVGVAPLYENWDVYYQLTNPATKSVVWETKSTEVLLQGLLPSANGITPFEETVLLPGTLPVGTYNMNIIVKDPANQRRPLQLAINGKQTDGSYQLGTIEVAVAGTTSPVPTPTASPTPAPTSTVAPTASPTPTPSGSDTQVPSVSVTAPDNNAVIKAGQRISIQASATDNVKVSKVVFYAGPTGETPSVLCTDTKASYSCAWRSPKLATGTQYTLEAIAYDTANNAASSKITITLQP